MKQILLLACLVISAHCWSQDFEVMHVSPATPGIAERSFLDVAIHSSGALYAIEGESKTVQVYEGGNLSSTISSLEGSGQKIALINPKRICFDMRDNLYIYDEELRRILVRYADGRVSSFGGDGRSSGISSLSDFAVDSKGFIYVLNDSYRQIDVYSEKGEYLTWIKGTNLPFSNPIAVGVNGADELYVMEKEGPTVYMFDVTGNLVNTNRSLSNRKGVSLSRPVDMAVMSNGNFFILDAAANQATLFDRIGAVVTTIGSKGDGSKGTFKSVRCMAGGPAHPEALAIVDASLEVCQTFHLVARQIPYKSDVKRLRIAASASSRTPACELEAAPNGNRYIIPARDRKKVVAFKDTSNVDLFTITGKFDEAVDIAADTASNLYVVDGASEQILFFDQKGNMVRKFGQEIPDKLKDPVSIAIQHSGNIIVADRSRSSLFMWNEQGVFRKIITSPENSVISDPLQIEVDSKDQIYVWDDDCDCIYRVGSGGWPTAEKKLTARPKAPGDSPGKIGGFFVDPLDHLVIYNSSNRQIEVYKWDFEPVCIFSAGAPDAGANFFDDISHVMLDDLNMYLYCTVGKGETQKVYQLIVPPVKPEGNLVFDVLDGKLNVYFGKVKSPSVVAYGLVTGSGINEKIAYRTSGSSIVIDNDTEVALHRYDFVSMSRSDRSDPSASFDDYFTYAENLLKAQRYEEALGSYQLAMDKMGKPQRMSEHIVQRLCASAVDLASRQEVEVALAYVRYANSIGPKNPLVAPAFNEVLKAYYRQLAGRGEINAISADISSYAAGTSLRKLAMNAVDTMATIMSTEESESSITSAISLLKKLTEWEADNPRYNHSLAFAHLQLYRFKTIRDASTVELRSMLSEVIRNARIAFTALKAQNQPYFAAHLVLLEAQNHAGYYEEVQLAAASELGKSSAQMDQKTVIAYRTQLALAFDGMSKFENAISEYNSILAFNPADKNYNEALAEELVKAKKYDDARAVYQKLLTTDSENARYIARIGIIELNKNNAAEAAFQLEKSLKLDPSDRSVYGYLGEAFERSSKNDKALDNYEVALVYLDDVLARTEQRNYSVPQIYEFRSRRERYLQSCADICEELGNKEEAARFFQRLTTVSPDNAAAWYSYGKACQSAGRVYDAIDAFDKALSYRSGDNTYKNAYVNAVKLRENALKSEPALNIVHVEPAPIFPAMYNNYSDIQRLPVGEFILANNSPDAITPQHITVSIPGLTSQATEVQVKEINGYTNQMMKMSAIIPASVLQNNDPQTLQMEVVMTFTHNGKNEQVKKTAKVEINGRNAITWSDKRFMAAFVNPNEEKIVEYSKNVDLLFRNAPTYDMNKAYLKALQLYTVLNESGITYSRDPAQSYSVLSVHNDRIDYLQFPGETLKRKAGDCDDLVALYASLLENSGIGAAYIDLPGHVMVAFDSQVKPNEIAAHGLEPKDVIIAGNKVWIPIESTYLGSRNFFLAWNAGAERYYKELAAGRFPELIPFADAWTVYRPAAYFPESFQPAMPSESEVMRKYETLINELVSRTRQKTIAEMRDRYATEAQNAFVKNEYATLLAQTGDLQRAEVIYIEALELNPESASILNNLGNIAFLKGDNDKAVEYYEKAAQSDERDPNILINLCKVNLAKGNKSAAKVWFDKAVNIDPEVSEIYLDLKTQLK